MSDSAANVGSRGGFPGAAAIVLLAALVVFPLLFGYSMGRSLSHDEQQHVAAGALVAREGLLPYRDFPYLHTPYLPLIYGLFLGHGKYLLLGTRTFSAVCGSLIAGLLFFAAFRAFAGRGMGWRLLIAAATVFAFLASPVVVYTFGRSSNHEVSILFAILAVLCHLAALRTGRGLPLFFSGLFLALTVGSRVTFAPLGAPFLASIFFLPATTEKRATLKRFGIFVAGGILGGLPLLWLFIEAPARFVFGVLQFAQVNIDYREAEAGRQQNMTLLPKLRYLFKEIVASNFAMCAAAVLPLVAYEWQRRRAHLRLSRELAFLLCLLPFLLIGSLAPSPTFEQYYCALVPFLLLVGIYSGAEIKLTARFAGVVTSVVAAVLVGSFFMVWSDYRSVLGKYSQPENWTPFRRHRDAQDLLKHTTGPVLTLAPVWPLEAGMKIIPEFATGPFLWRVSSFVAPERRERLGIVCPADLEAFFHSNPPAAIFLGKEKSFEEPLRQYAQSHGYQRSLLSDPDDEIWLSKNPAPPAE